MSAVNNTLWEIILRERPLTVTNNGSLFLSLVLSFLLFSSLTPCLYLLPFVAPCVCGVCTPYPFSTRTPVLRGVYIPHAFFHDPLRVRALEVRKRSWSIPALESMQAPGKKNQAAVVTGALRFN